MGKKEKRVVAALAAMVLLAVVARGWGVWLMAGGIAVYFGNQYWGRR